MEQMNVRILLTGRTGQVGGALCAPLGDLGTVISPDRSQLDLSRPEAISDALDQLKPSLIVNPAAYTAVDRAEDERLLAFRVNADAPKAIAIWAARHKVPLVHFSTDYVFDGSGERPWREDDAPGPLSTYGASKLAGEAAIVAVGGEHLIIRTSWVYANRGQNFMLTIARLAAERKELRIVSDQFGAPTSARVIADAVMKVLTAKQADPATLFLHECGIINVSSSGETSWCGFAAAIVAGLKNRGLHVETECVVPIKAEEYPTKARRPRNSRLDLGRLQEIFGIRTLSWQEALEIELDELADFRRTSISPAEPMFDRPRAERLVSIGKC
jgi:dTDP-4-dehydrorhamnose reductase